MTRPASPRSWWREPTVDYTGDFWFPVDREVLWAAIEEFDAFETWWSWLREFSAETRGLVDGNVLRGLVVPPVPYRLHLRVTLDSCTRPSSVEATIDGDLRGHAALLLSPVDGGTGVAAAWTLEMASMPMKVAARVAYPVVRWGHDRVVDMTVAGFRRRLTALGGSS